MTDSHWVDCIRAFLHDPFDKALDVRGHEGRTLQTLNAALNTPDGEARGSAQKRSDWLASAIERLPLPMGTLWADGKPLPDEAQPFNRIASESLRRTHPFSGIEIPIAHQTAKSQAGVDKLVKAVRAIAEQNPDLRLRAYALWRALPDTLGQEVSTLPADTRLTDHSIVDHADAAMACCAGLRHTADALTETPSSTSLLVFSLGPVQSFIVQGRSLRDLWTGSYLLSWLTYQAMVPLLQALGPWSILSPGLRGNPLCDWWLLREGVKADALPQTDPNDLRWAGIPNTFTALVPAADAERLRQVVIAACQQAWQNIANAVHTKLSLAWKHLGSWDWQWKEQCSQVWDVRCVVAPFLTVTDSGSIATGAEELGATCQRVMGELPQPVVDAKAIAEALITHRLAPGYVTAHGQGLWMLAAGLAHRLLDADKRARAVPPPAIGDDSREKCALFPGFAVMGPNGDTRANKDWWRQAHACPPRLVGRLRSERLSAPGLVKRFAFGAFFRDLFAVGFPDTREAAFAAWTDRFRKKVADGNLHWSNWQRTVDGINRRSEDDLEQAWAAHELLDEGTMVAANWPMSDDQEGEVHQEELKRARGARGKMISQAKDHGLPEPKPYYAILVADGDHMGRFLRGEQGPTFSQAYHPLMLAKLRGLGLSPDLFGRVRPPGMAAQVAFSRALGDFTTAAAHTIAKHHGTCVYAGGDDILAVLPVQTALSAAAELAKDFSTWVPGATLSAGLAIVHCHEDLRAAIELARMAERQAKQGRNALAISIARRSGDTTSAVMGWPLVGDWQRAAELLAERSDRWVHHLVDEWQTLRTLPLAAVWERVRHHLLHGEEGSRESQHLGELFSQISTTWGSWCGDKAWSFLTSEQRIDHFLTACQHAAWLGKFQFRDVAAKKASA